MKGKKIKDLPYNYKCVGCGKILCFCGFPLTEFEMKCPLCDKLQTIDLSDRSKEAI